MSIWLVSYVALWLLVLLIVMCVVVLFRQLGVLHLRFGPRGALGLNEGPPLRSEAPVAEVVDMRRRKHRIGGVGSATTLVFVSPRCAICEDLVPAIRALHRAMPSGARLLVVSDGDEEASAAYARQLSSVPVVADPNVAQLYRVVETPFALHIDPDGIVARKGVVNTLEQLESVTEDPQTELVELEVATNGKGEVHLHEHA